MVVSRYCACASEWTGNVYNYIDGGKQGPGSYNIFVYGVVGKFIGLQMYLLLALMERLQILTEVGKGLISFPNSQLNFILCLLSNLTMEKSSQGIGNLSLKWTRSRSIKNVFLRLFMEQPNLSSTNLPPQRRVLHF